MNRRSYLAVSGVALTSLSAGCVGRFDNDDQEYAFNLHNGAREAHSITVRIGNELDTYFYRETFDMEPNTANEDVPIEDIPAVVGVQIDDSDEYEFGWPASVADDGTIASMSTIYYDPTYYQQLMVHADN